MTLTTQYLLPSTLRTDYHVQVLDARPILPVNPKYTWETNKPPRPQDELSTIVLHHDALSKAKMAGVSDVELATRIANNHIRLKANLPGGDPGFPYHIWIRNGIIYTTNNLEAFTYGVKSNNGYTVHICVSGDYDGGQKTDAKGQPYYKQPDVMDERDRRALYAAIIMVRSLLPSCTAIKGHEEIMPTNCPGYDVRAVRNDVIKLELDMQHAGSPDGQLQLIYAAYTRFANLYGTASKSGQYQQRAIELLTPIAAKMKEDGLLG